MHEALNLTEIDGQHVELLPSRTVLSMFSQDIAGSAGGATGGISNGTVFGGYGSYFGQIIFGGVFGSGSK